MRQGVVVKNNILLFCCFIISACIPYRSAWEGDRNRFIGMKLDPQLILTDGSYGAKYGSYFFDTFVERKFDNVVVEDNFVRYYITWRGRCQYSILLDKEGVMHSWRYETEQRQGCIVN